MKIQLSLILFILLSTFNIFATPIPISNIHELQNINLQTGDYYLTNDIDATETKNWDNGKGFFPIEIENGSFNGNGYKIFNLYINRPNHGPGIGLFGVISNFNIENLTLENVNISSNGEHEGFDWVDVGALVGEAENSTLKNIKVTGNIKGGKTWDDYTGGIIGYDVEETNVLNCIVNANITGNSLTGGIAGAVSYINNCSFTGNITTDDSAGGIAGSCKSVENSTAQGTIIAIYEAGGIAGDVDSVDGFVKNCTFKGNITTEDSAGGIVGSCKVPIENSTAQGTIIGNYNVGGIAGYTHDLIFNCSFKGNIEGNDVTGGIAGGCASLIENSHAEATIKGKYHVGGIVGKYDGYGYSVIINCSFNGNIEGDEGTGGIAGYCSYPIENSTVQGTIKGNIEVGGIAGFTDGKIDNCSFNGNIEGGRLTGGIVGNSYNTIKDSTTKGTIKGNDEVGGIAGCGEDLIDNCSFNGNVIGEKYIGGIVGNCYAIIKNSTAQGSIEGNSFLGGITGKINKYKNISPYFLENTFYNYNSMLFNGKYALTPGVLYNSQYNNWISNGRYLSISNYPNLKKLKPGHFQISSIDGLKDLLGFSQHRDKTWYLTKDIDFSNEDKFFIPYLIAKEFNGNGYKIINFHSKPQTNIQSFGFIGIFSGAKENDPAPELESSIKNINFINTNINLSNKLFRNINIGGVIGTALYSIISNIHSINTIITTNEISNSYIGGIIGECNDADLRQSSFTGTINNIDSNSNPFMGGICGKSFYGAILNCYAQSKVTGSNQAAQGFGYVNLTTLYSCYINSNTGKNNNLFIYEVEGYATDINSCYAVGKSDSFINKLPACNIENCYWDKTYAGKPSDYVDPSSGVTALTTAQMGNQANFTGWDFDNTWIMQGTYPILKWQVTQTNGILNIKDNIKQIKLGSKEPEELKPILKSYYN